MNEADIVIDVHGLTKKFDGRAVVRNLSMQVKRGTIYGFLGPNGSGKTTTIRMLCGLLTPDEGTGTCLGYDIRTETDKIKLQVGYMTQRFSLYQDLSVRENLEFIGRIYGIAQPVAAARAAIERLGLNGREEQLAGELSGGWKQRLALGACTLPSPKLLLLDEPTAGVDPKARREFWNEIHALAAEGLTVLVSTHYMDEAERCHEIAYIAYGELLAHGTVEEVIESSHLTTYIVSARSGEGLNTLAEELNKKAGHRHGGPVRHQPACVRARCRQARGGHRAISKAQRLRMAALGAFARRCLHRSDEQGAGQFPMSHMLPAQAPRRIRGNFLTQDLGGAGEGIHPAQARPRFIRDDHHGPAHSAAAVRLCHQHQPAASADRRPAAGEQRPRALNSGRARKTPTISSVTERPRSEAELDEMLASGKILFGIEIPRNFERSVRRGDKPAMLIVADATDPVAASAAARRARAGACKPRSPMTAGCRIPASRRSRSGPTSATIRQALPNSISCRDWSAPF